MSEKVRISEVKEILDPRNTPEMGFQSYVMLEGEKEEREKTRSDFVEGKIVNPKLDYPRLDVERLNHGTRVLQNVLSVADTVEGETERLAVWNSAAFRIAEMYWLKNLAYLQQIIEAGADEEQIEALSKEQQWLNEQLYGRLSPEFTEAIFGEIFSQIEQKELTESSEALFKDLKEGFSIEIEGEEVKVPATFIETDKRLAKFEGSGLGQIKDILETTYGDVFDVIDEYYESVISQRSEEERVFTPDDMYKLYQIFQSKNEFAAQINVIFDEDASRMSWDTERMAIIVGGRRKNIKSKSVMASKLIHEYGIHAVRTLKGSSSELPTLGTGIFTEIEDKFQSDYLTFEEGFASICEFAVAGNKNKWDTVDLEKPAAIALAYKGMDFRQIYESLWRIRCLLKVKDDKELAQESIDKEKLNTYNSVERVFRGTPSDLSRVNRDGTPRILTYNKDLAYLSGKLMALEFIKSTDPETLQLVFKGRFDPTNPKHLALAKKYL